MNVRKIGLILLLLALSLLHPGVRSHVLYTLESLTIRAAEALRIDPPTWTWRMPRVPSK